MKKILIPILTTAAIAPVATSLVACGSSTINMNFQTGFGGEADLFVKDGFDIKANKEYKFIADFSKVPDEILADWDGDEGTALGFVAFPSINDLQPLKYAGDKFQIKLNDKDITSTAEVEEGDGYIWVPPHKWTKKDKLVITITWTETKKDAIVVWIPD